jgi:DNA topoisomerase-2
MALSQEQEEGGPVDKKVADYDYLVGMAMWKLSMEDKDKLLKESEEKKKELATLQQKSWSDLWEEDLTEFLIALEKQEKKEKADIEETIKTAAKKLTKDGNAAMRGGAKKFAEEVKPNPKAIRIEPTLDHMKEKYTEKPKREPKVKKEKKVKKEGQDIRSFLENGEENGVEENGEDDWPGQNEDDDETSTKEVKPKKGKEPKSKTETKAKAPRAKKATGQSGPSKKSKKKIDVSDEEIDDIVISDDDDDDQPGPSVQRSPPARRARPTVKYSVSDGESDDDVIPVKKSRKIISDDEDFAAEED